jgi:hypothetical protein
MCLFSIPSYAYETTFTPSFTFLIEQFFNWVNTASITATDSFSLNNYRILQKLNSNLVYSHKFRLSGNDGNKAVISSVSIEFEDVQGKPTE